MWCSTRWPGEFVDASLRLLVRGGVSSRWARRISAMRRRSPPNYPGTVSGIRPAGGDRRTHAGDVGRVRAVRHQELHRLPVTHVGCARCAPAALVHEPGPRHIGRLSPYPRRWRPAPTAVVITGCRTGRGGVLAATWLHLWVRHLVASRRRRSRGGHGQVARRPKRRPAPRNCQVVACDVAIALR